MVKSSKMAKKKILFINQEITPYVPDNSLSLMGKELPKVMQERSHEIRTFMPKWGNINERRGQLHEVIRLSGMNLIINDTDHPLIIKVASIQSARVYRYISSITMTTSESDSLSAMRQVLSMKIMANALYSLHVVCSKRLRSCAGFPISSTVRVG